MFALFLVLKELGIYLEPQTTMYKWLFQLDEPKLSMKHGCFTNSNHPKVDV